jgi:hypothetical protein
VKLYSRLSFFTPAEVLTCVVISVLWMVLMWWG